MAALDVDRAVSEYAQIWAEETLEDPAYAGVALCYSVALVTEVTMCQSHGIFQVEPVIQAMMHVSLPGIEEPVVVIGAVPMNLVIDGDMEPVQMLLDHLWEQVRFLWLCGGEEFDTHLEEIAQHHGDDS